MKITKIHLRNFKRFTDLVVREVPASAKLVVVVGPNGSGKSSLFDAFLQWHRFKANFGFHGDEAYARKSRDEDFRWHDSVEIELADGAMPRRGSLYVRSAYRNDPDFTIKGVNRMTAPSEEDRLKKLIDTDATVSANYQRLVYDTMAAVYDRTNDAKTVGELREELIGQVRESMKRVFGDLLLNNISDPLGAGAFYFEKGTSKAYHYKNLSGGEKAAFDLLLDVHVKKKFFADAVYCIDELETHLHTRVQGTLVREIVSVLPDASQLWVSTHSLGVLRAAQEMESAQPGMVAVIDFDGVDPDVPREIVPSNLGRVSWEKMMSLALDDLSLRIAPKVIVVCEGSSLGNHRKDFDAEIYNRILGSRNPEVVFVSGGASNQVTVAGVSVAETLGKIIPTAGVIALMDRDDRSDEEVREIEERGSLVLTRRNLESFLFSDEVIEALVRRTGKDELLVDAIKIKQDALERSVTRGNAKDDLKSAAGEIYVGLKRLLALVRPGNNAAAFMQDTLAPLVVPSMATYQDLKAAIMDKLAAVAKR